MLNNTIFRVIHFDLGIIESILCIILICTTLNSEFSSGITPLIIRSCLMFNVGGYGSILITLHGVPRVLNFGLLPCSRPTHV
jgi:hypothetical protein